MQQRIVHLRLLDRSLFAVLIALAIPAAAHCEDSSRPGLYEPSISESERLHWSFVPLERPALPTVESADWPTTPIDHFILSQLEQNGLFPMPPADRVILIRRVTFDLIGLPPTPDEVDDFVNDASPDAYERLVDRLLSSPHYGERWAQHWLDVARFAETDGFEHDHVRSEAWRFRDWVIDALNRDLPYDRFVQLQLAGDELAPQVNEAAIATMFCLAGPDMPDINSMEERKHNLLNEMTSTVGSVFLGLQVGCAQCHDHKFDPISQADFYRLRAIFEPAVHVEKNKSVSTLQERDGQLPVSHVMLRGDWRRKGAAVAPALPRIANPSNESFQTADVGNTSSGRRAAFANWLTRGDNPLTSRVIVNRLWQYHFGQGLCSSPSDFGVMGDRPTHPELLDWLATELIRQNWSIKQLHRLIVLSATYRQSSKIADWGLQIAESDTTHSRSSESNPPSAILNPHSHDPRNRLLSRIPRKRLEGEAIRDAMLTAAGVLNNQRGGPGVRPPLPEELVATLLRNQWDVTPDEAEHNRRSVYVFARRNLRYPIFEAFDRPDANASCPRRDRSTTAPQSLLMINSEFSLQMARRLAGLVFAEVGSDADEQIALCYRRTLSRMPSAEEMNDARQFIGQQSELLRAEGRTAEQLALPIPNPSDVDPYESAALTDLCLALFNSNEFIYID